MKTFINDIKKRTLIQIIIYAVMLPLTIATFTIGGIALFNFEHYDLIAYFAVLGVIFAIFFVACLWFSTMCSLFVEEKKLRDKVFFICIIILIALVICAIIIALCPGLINFIFG